MIIKKAFLGMVLSLAAGISSAWGGTASGLVNQIITTNGNTVFIYVDAVETGRPSCNDQAQRFAINTATQGGRNMLAIATAAYLSGKPVIILGTNTCDPAISGDSESVAYILTH